jgi:hypothetical protein
MKKPEVLERQCAEMKARNLGSSLFTAFQPKWTERHYTVEELAKMWGLSKDTITRIFENEGVFDASRNPHGRKDRLKRRLEN